MKARLKETGKWITVDTCTEGFYDVETHDIYEPDELDFAPAFDWAAYRSEAAKDILCAMVGPTMYDLNAGAVAMVGAAIAVDDEVCKEKIHCRSRVAARADDEGGGGM